MNDVRERRDLDYLKNMKDFGLYLLPIATDEPLSIELVGLTNDSSF